MAAGASAAGRNLRLSRPRTDWWRGAGAKPAPTMWKLRSLLRAVRCRWQRRPIDERIALVRAFAKLVELAQGR
ncbi:MAG: hypothetical protein R3C46_00090 [Hyphomonadaceae bacterium]